MLSTLISLFTIWVILSGYFKSFFLISGLLSCLIAIIFFRKEINNFSYIPSYKWIQYYVWLVHQMILSALTITKIVWQINPKISPTITVIPHKQKNTARLAILANSITFTPGTLTVLHDNNDLHIHSLVKEDIRGVNNIIKQLEQT